MGISSQTAASRVNGPCLIAGRIEPRTGDDVIAQLRRNPVFAAMDPGEVARLLQRARRRWFAANQALFHEGDPGDTVHFILSGHVNIRRVTSSGDLLHLARRGPGELIGMLALVDGRPRMADAVTGAPSELLTLFRVEFAESLERHPRAMLALTTCLADRLRQAADEFELHVTQDVLGRVAAALLALAAAERVDGIQATEVRIRVNQQALAHEVGSTRESVSRAISRLRQVGAIASEGRLISIRDPGRLRSLL